METFVQNLLQLPPEPEILSEAVYANSQTLDGRRFAEEFVRKRKLADKGIVENSPLTSNYVTVGGSSGADGTKGAGGWSEVAKRGPAVAAAAQTEREEMVSDFKVVAAKKKGKK